MKEQITVDKAIKRGHLIVNIPVFITIISCPALALYFKKKYLIPDWGIGVAFLIGFLFAWLVWSFMITKWRIWAFENVRNVHELKKKAIQEKLIWNDGNIFEKTEIRNTEDTSKLKKIEKKFEQEDEYKEDYSLPAIMEIHNSKTYNYFELGVSIFIIGIGLYFFTTREINHYILGGITTIFGLYSTINKLRKVLDSKPIIVVDSKGIQTKNVEFKKWKNIEKEEVTLIDYGKLTRSYLTYFYDKNKIEKIEIGSLNVTHGELENIIRTYRIRNNKTSLN